MDPVAAGPGHGAGARDLPRGARREAPGQGQRRRHPLGRRPAHRRRLDPDLGLQQRLPGLALRAVPPAVTAKAAPKSGGVLLRTSGLDGARVDLTGPSTLGGEIDGTGQFGAISVPPGHYAVTIHPAGLLAIIQAPDLDVSPGS